jgi:hypothetical protein
MLDKPVVDNVESEPLGKPGDNIFAKRAHFARHCYNGHGDLLRMNSLALCESNKITKNFSVT